MAARKPLDIPISQQKPANLPKTDSFGRKLPRSFKSFFGASKIKKHDPTGKEVRVTVSSGKSKMVIRQHTFKDLRTATPFLDASLAVWKDAKPGTAAEDRNKTQKSKVEFGDGRTLNLKVGDKTPKR